MNDERNVVVSGMCRSNAPNSLQQLAALRAMLPDNHYSDTDLMSFFKHIDKKDKIFKDCSVCGSKRVNIYYKDGKWKCRKCWEKEQCEKCSHRGQETMGDVGSCNCCEHGSFFSEEKINE